MTNWKKPLIIMAEKELNRPFIPRKQDDFTLAKSTSKMWLSRHVFNQLLATFTACLTIYVSGIWLGWTSVVLLKIKEGEIHIPMTESDITWVVALMDFGNLFSPIFASYIMDRIGRLFAIRLAGLTFCLTSLLVLTASAPQHLYLARLFAGFGKGIGYTVAPMYIAEIAGPQIRGALSGLFIIMMTGGSACSMTFGPYISFDTLNWATLVVPTTLLILSTTVQESPYYFYMRNKEAAAQKAFRWFRGGDTGPVDREMDAIKEKVADDMRQETGFSSLFKIKGTLKALEIVLVSCAFQRLGGISCTLAYASTTLPKGNSWDPKITVMAFGWACTAGGILSSLLIDHFGRKPLLILSTVALSLVQGASAVFYYFREKSDEDVAHFTFVPHTAVVLFGWFYGVGLGQIPHTLQSELFPTNVKSHASAISTMVLSICSFVVNKIYIPVGRLAGVYAMFVEFALANLLCALFTVFCVFETKGRTLTEIQSILNDGTDGLKDERKVTRL